MVVTRKVRVPGKKDEVDEATTSNEIAEEIVEQVLPDASEPAIEKDEIEQDLQDMETVENIKEELERTDDSLGKRVSKPTFKVKLAKQGVPGKIKILLTHVLCS